MNGLPARRIQLTLFVPASNAKHIEAIRRQFNPTQYLLIKSHVTLCRENELENVGSVIANLKNLKSNPLAIQFDGAKRFSNGQGVLLPARGENPDFQSLRRQVLMGANHGDNNPQPHITLMHPRNSLCDDITFASIQKYDLPKSIVFNKISLIEQIEGGKWSVLSEFELAH